MAHTQRVLVEVDITLVAEHGGVPNLFHEIATVADEQTEITRVGSDVGNPLRLYLFAAGRERSYVALVDLRPALEGAIAAFPQVEADAAAAEGDGG